MDEKKDFCEIIESEVTDEIELLSEMNLGSEDYEKTVNGVKKLTDSIVDFKKLDNESKKMDIELKKIELEVEKLKVDKKDRKWKNGIAIGTFVGSTLAYAAANVYNWKKELQGTMTFDGGKKAMNSLFGIMDKFKK